MKITPIQVTVVIHKKRLCMGIDIISVFNK